MKKLHHKLKKNMKLRLEGYLATCQHRDYSVGRDEWEENGSGRIQVFRRLPEESKGNHEKPGLE
jgi:hypothetical protein